MTKRRQSIIGLPEPNTEANRKRRRSLVAATKRRKKKSKTSMNLWIILALTWISITVVIADHGWFVQDSPPVGEEDELFSSEQLLLVKPKAKSKPKSVTSMKVNTDHHAKENPKKKVFQQKQKNQSKPGKKSAVNDVVSEQFIPVQKTGRKPLSVPEKQTETKKTAIKVTSLGKKSQNPPTGSSKTINQAWFIQDDSLNEEENDNLFSSENLLVVKPKLKYKPKPAKPTKSVVKAENPSETNNAKQQTKKVENKQKSPSKSTKTSDVNDVESEHLIPVHGAVRKPLAVAQNPVEKVKPVEKPAAPVKEVEEFDEVPCDSEKNIDCLMETEEQILVEKKKPAKPAHKVDTKPLIKRENVEATKQEVVKKIEPKPKKVEEVQRAALHRRLLDSDKSSTTQPSKPVQQPLLYEIKEEEEAEEDLLETEKGDEDILRRLRRQATSDDFGSGDQTASFQSETPVTSNPLYNMQFSVTLDTPTTQTLTDELRQQYADDLVRRLNATFYAFPGYVGIAVRNISLDENGRVVADWDLILSQSGAPGSGAANRTQALLGFLNNTVVPAVNNLVVLNAPIYTPLDKDVTLAIAEAALSDICQAANSCPNGYVCIHRGTISLCQHKCYSTGLMDQCENGGSCQLDQAFEPYCQCGSGFTGDLCQNTTTEADTTYSTTQIVGAGVAGAVAVAGLVASCIYLAAFWRRGEKDMEYSYFGDDDQTPTAYNDADANLGSSYVIPRATVDLTPADIYNGANV